MEELMSTLNVDQLSGLLAGGVLGMFVGGFFVLQIGYYILNIIGCWKIYNKLGEPGWKCLEGVDGVCHLGAGHRGRSHGAACG